MNKNNKYGYKLGYKEFKYEKLKTQRITNSYDLCVWEIEWYSTHPFYDRYDFHLIKNPIWHIGEIKTLKQYNRYWQGCPFKEELD